MRGCAVEMHVNISERPLYAEIYRKNAAPENRGADLCEPVQLKRMSRFHKSHFMRKFTGKKVRTGLYSCRKNSSVWTHCLGKKPRFLVVQLYVPHSSPCFPMFFSQVLPSARARCRRCRWQCRRRRLRHRRSGGSCRHARHHSHRRRSCRSGCPAEGDAAWTHHGINMD